MPSKSLLLLNGKPTTAKEIEEQLNLAADDLLESAAFELQKQLERLIANLNRRSTMRGRGVHAEEYNRPFKEAVVKTDRKKGKIIVSVDHKVFNILDQGRRAYQARRLMLFPEYKGTLTKPDDSTLNRKKVIVADRPVWRVIQPGTEISAIEPRNFYKNIAKKITFTKRRLKRGKSILEFPIDPRFIQFEVITEDGT